MRILTLRSVVERASLVLLFPLLLTLGGCDRLRPKPPAELVYVVAKQTFLRDRVAAVSNRVGLVNNGQQLKVLEHGRRFLKVKTDKGEVGWIEERAVIPADVYTQFQVLQKEHANDPVVATAVLRDDLYLHVKPGRETDRFYLLPENDKLQLLVRASVPKGGTPQAMPPRSVPSVKKPGDKAKTSAAVQSMGAKVTQVAEQGSAKGAPPTAGSTPNAEALPEVPLEDWWLVRDAEGRVGWLLSRRMDVDVPDAIAGYGEGQRIVGAYVLTTVTDDASKAPNHQVPEYVAVLNAYKDGLPYDFDQVRVFTWNLKKHRYETAYRERKLQGYLPVKVGRQSFDKLGEQPVFEFKQGVGEGVTIDPQTGATQAAQTVTEQFRLEGVQVKKVGPAPPPAAAPAEPKPEGHQHRAPRAPREKHHKAHKTHR
jgi:uncharacterized protein YgiM (DUF1202 family)